MAADNDHEYTGAAIQGLQDLLRGNGELHSLTAITGGKDEICPIIRPERWARMLRVLVLEQHSMNPAHLEAFVIASQLQEVRLRDILLESYHSNRVAPEWVEIAHRMGGQLKKLQYVQLVRITGTSPLDGKTCRSNANGRYLDSGKNTNARAPLKYMYRHPSHESGSVKQWLTLEF